MNNNNEQNKFLGKYDSQVIDWKYEDEYAHNQFITIVVLNHTSEEFERVCQIFSDREGYRLVNIGNADLLSPEEIKNIMNHSNGMIIDSRNMSNQSNKNFIVEYTDTMKKNRYYEIYDSKKTEASSKDYEELIIKLLSESRRELAIVWGMEIPKRLSPDLFESEEKLDRLEEVILDLFKLKDKTTFNHVKGVYELSSIMINGLDNDGRALSNEDGLMLRQAALMHDIAKMITPEQLLRNSDFFSVKEYKQMQRHADICGAFMFSSTISDVVKVASLHHTTYNNDYGYVGNDYDSIPKTEEINPLARMLTVIDAFEAMTAFRPYNSGMSIDAAFNTLVTKSNDSSVVKGGGQFDPKYVYAFLLGFKDKYDTSPEFKKQQFEKEQQRNAEITQEIFDNRVLTSLDECIEQCKLIVNEHNIKGGKK